MNRIEIVIDELVLEGFAPSDKYRIGEAVTRELERLFLESAPQPMPETTRERVDAGAFVMQGTRGESIGAQIASSVFKSLHTPE